MHYLDYLTASHHFGQPIGLPSICSAHPLVIEAALRHGLAHGKPVLIEATCNQVNQFGGYTGQTPADFFRFVTELADTLGFPRRNLILGGDHLGPLPWADEPAESAMQKAGDLVRAFVLAGFTKIHLDCSMPLGGEKELSLEVIAQRTASLAKIAEETFDSIRPSSTARSPLRYVIGSEVPAAGGAKAGETHLVVTRPESAAETLELTRRAFQTLGLDSAWERVRALVVQPGVEFGDQTIHEYDPIAAAQLARFIETVPGLVYEAHSTDYQRRESLAALVRDHFAILKVGPALTFAFREAVFSLAMIENELFPPEERSHLIETLEAAMQREPNHWKKHYHGDERQLALARKYSLSDRIRYYWNKTDVQNALKKLLNNLERAAPLPLTLLSQYLPEMIGEIREGRLPNRAPDILLRKVQAVLDDYRAACGQN